MRYTRSSRSSWKDIRLPWRRYDADSLTRPRVVRGAFYRPILVDDTCLHTACRYWLTIGTSTCHVTLDRGCLNVSKLVDAADVIRQGNPLDAWASVILLWYSQFVTFLFFVCYSWKKDLSNACSHFDVELFVTVLFMSARTYSDSPFGFKTTATEYLFFPLYVVRHLFGRRVVVVWTSDTCETCQSCCRLLGPLEKFIFNMWCYKCRGKVERREILV